MIKVIGFDLGGVYLSDCWNKSVREKIADKFNIQKEMIEENNKKIENVISEGKISEDVFLRNVIGDVTKIKEVKDYIRQLNRIIYPELLQLMINLKENYRLVVMNNEAKEWNDFRIKKFNLKQIFEEFFRMITGIDDAVIPAYKFVPGIF